MISEPWIRSRQCLVLEPEEGVGGIFVGSREGMLRVYSILDGSNDGVEVGCSMVEVEEEGSGGAEEDESTTLDSILIEKNA